MVSDHWSPSSSSSQIAYVCQSLLPLHLHWQCNLRPVENGRHDDSGDVDIDVGDVGDVGDVDIGDDDCGDDASASVTSGLWLSRTLV